MSEKSFRLAVVGLLTVIAALVAVGIFVLSRAPGPRGTEAAAPSPSVLGPDPRATVEQFWRSIADRDPETMDRILAADFFTGTERTDLIDSRAMAVSAAGRTSDSGPSWGRLDLDPPVVTGTSATVVAQFCYRDGATWYRNYQTFLLHLDGGVWLIDQQREDRATEQVDNCL